MGSSYQVLVSALTMHTLKQHLFFGKIELHPLPDFSFLLYVRQGQDSCNYVLKTWNRELTGWLILFLFFFAKAILLFFPHPSLQRRGAKIKCTHRKREHMSAQPLQPSSVLSGTWELIAAGYSYCPRNMPRCLLCPCRISLLQAPVCL